MTVRGALLLLLIMGPGGALPTRAQSPLTPLDSVILLPFANRSGSTLASAELAESVERAVREHFATVRTSMEVRPVLREHRIRSLGSIGRRGTRILHEETGIPYALVGSYEIYSTSASREVGLALRLIDLQSQSLIGAVAMGRTWQETERSFGRRAVEDQVELGAEVTRDLVSELVAQIGRNAPSPAHKSDLVALVQLNDHSGNGAGSVVETALLASLLEGGFPVVEPGFVRELQLDHSLVQRGGASGELVERLRDDLGVRWVLTGAVDRFELAGSDTEAAFPRAEWGLRLIDARSNRLLAAIDLDQSGSDSDSILGRGRIHSGIDLIRQGSRERVLPWLEKEVQP